MKPIHKTHKVHHEMHIPKMPKKAGYAPPPEIGKSSSRSTAFTCFRVLSAPITIPLTLAGGLVAGVGVTGLAACGVVYSIAKIAGPLGKLAAGLVLSPIVALSGLVTIIGTCVMLSGGMILAPGIMETILRRGRSRVNS